MIHQKSIKIMLTENPEGYQKYLVDKLLNDASKKQDIDTADKETIKKLKEGNVNFVKC